MKSAPNDNSNKLKITCYACGYTYNKTYRQEVYLCPDCGVILAYALEHSVLTGRPSILIACEESQVVTIEFRQLGFDAFSCDIEPCSGGHPEWHIQDNVEHHLNDGWDMMIAHPPCTYLTNSGNKWMKPEFKDRFPHRIEQREQAIEFFLKLYNAPIYSVAIENPVGVMSRVFRKPDQYVHPYQFGDPHSKKTGWWLKPYQCCNQPK